MAVLDRIANYFYQRGRLRGAGQLLTYAAVSWCMFGIAGHSLTAVLAALLRRPALTLVDVLPSIPTWWIPEHPVSFALVVILGVSGVFLSIEGKRLDRYLNG